MFCFPGESEGEIQVIFVFCLSVCLFYIPRLFSPPDG